MYSSLDSSGGDYSELLDELDLYQPDRSEREHIERVASGLRKADNLLQNVFEVVDALDEPVKLHPDLQGENIQNQLRTALSHLDAVKESANEICPTEVDFGAYNRLVDSVEYLMEEVRTLLSIIDSMER
jgi:DNA repair ATPase RecN